MPWGLHSPSLNVDNNISHMPLIVVDEMKEQIWNTIYSQNFYQHAFALELNINAIYFISSLKQSKEVRQTRHFIVVASLPTSLEHASFNYFILDT